METLEPRLLLDAAPVAVDDTYILQEDAGLSVDAQEVWKRVSPSNAEGLCAVGSDLYADLGASGLWKYDGVSFKRISAWDAQGLMGAGSVLYADFGGVSTGGRGLYKYEAGSWARININDAVEMAGVGANLYVEFEDLGLYQYDSTSFKRISRLNPEGMTVAGADLYVDFGDTGVSQYAGGVLKKVSTLNAEGLYGVGLNLYGDFGVAGGLQRYDGVRWTKKISLDAEGLVPVGSALYVDFGARGLYRYRGSVRANDIDLDGDALTVSVVSNPVYGTLSLNADGSFTYTPFSNFYGSDSFTYRASDGALYSNEATVKITVKGVNDAPTTSGIPDLIGDEDGPDTVIDLSQVFADVDLPYGDELTYTVTASGSIPILALLDQITEASYTDIHQDLLYTHLGNNRGLTGAQHDLARNNIFDYFEDQGLETSLDPFTYNSGTYYNVVGVQPGATRPDDIYIFGAHYDSVNNPGADDNASGVAAVMEAARILSMFEFEATLVYIAFDREEQGLVGSTAYANKHSADNILGVINFDMIAYNPAGTNHNKVRIYDGDNTDDPIKQEVLDAFNVSGYGRGVTAVNSGSIDRSDHAPFDKKGFEAVLLIEYSWGSNSHYHKSTDAVETANYLDYTFATSITAGSAGYIVSQAGLTEENLPLTVSMNGDQLILDYLDNLFGDAEITIRATDKANLYVEDTFKVTVNPVQNLIASKAASEDGDSGKGLTEAELQGIVAEAILRWSETVILDSSAEEQLTKVRFQIADLSGLVLGQATPDLVLIDLDAAGWGWFVDATPVNDVEFGLSLSDVEKTALATSPAFGRMDLLTVVMHELGHVFGFEDLDPNAGVLMSGTLDGRTRRLNDSTPDSPKLVQVDDLAGGDMSISLWGAKDNKASWLEDLLVDLAGKKDNPLDPTGKTKISIPGFGGGDKKKSS